jgi:hypothetical protein
MPPLPVAQRRSHAPPPNHSIEKENVMPNVEVERLPENFRNEIAKIYADNKPTRRAHLLAETAKLRSKYGAKIVALRRSYLANIVDAAERRIMAIENEHAATLTNAA